MKKTALCILLALMVASCKIDPKAEMADYYTCELSAEDPGDSHPKSLEFEAMLNEYVNRGLPGAVLLVDGPEGFFMEAAGMADVGLDVRMEPCHKLLIASISKMYTATVVYRLVDDGMIDLEKTAADYLNQDWIDRLANADEATLKQLLAHQSGIPDYLQPTAFDLEMINAPYKDWGVEDQMEYALGKAADFSPGTSYNYSNSNFVLLGLVAEAVSGKSLRQLYTEFIFAPLGLKNSYFDVEEPIPSGTAKGYVDLYSNGNIIEFESVYQNELYNGDGGIAATAQDMLIYFDALRGGQLISADSWAQMTTWFPLEGWGSQTFNGYGIELYDTEAGPGWGHTGGIYGFSSIMLYFPEKNTTMILLVNGLAGKIGDIESELLDAVFGEL
jgi:D-alanyl-D-alanine carboxypeptidase